MGNKISTLIFALILSLFAFSASAQVQSSDIVLSVSPQNPAPNQAVIASLSSYATDLNKANISWSANGQEIIAGIGKKTFSFNTGGPGSFINISAAIQTIDGANIIKTIAINPAEVDMLWQAADAYAPPFYKGKTFVPPEGSFKVVAMPNIVTGTGKASGDNLAYAWTRDGNEQPNASGWGKNYFILKNSYLDQNNEVEVGVSDILGNINASGEISLRTASPKIIFYEKDPAFGVKWEKALEDGFAVNPAGETFFIAPYFFSPKNLNASELVFDWFVNGEKIATPGRKNILSVKLESGQSGTARIKVAIRNAKTLFQNLEKEINVSF